MVKSKKEIVKMLLNTELDIEDEEQLLDLLATSPISTDINKQAYSNEKFSDKVADKITEGAGSWKFILSFCSLIAIWIIFNTYFLLSRFDPYPFILLNLILSCVAALQAPIIMMSQNRQAEKDRLRGQNDYKVDLKAELILEDIHEKIEKVLRQQREILKELNKNEEE